MCSLLRNRLVTPRVNHRIYRQEFRHVFQAIPLVASPLGYLRLNLLYNHIRFQAAAHPSSPPQFLLDYLHRNLRCSQVDNQALNRLGNHLRGRQDSHLASQAHNPQIFLRVSRVRSRLDSHQDNPLESRVANQHFSRPINLPEFPLHSLPCNLQDFRRCSRLIVRLLSQQCSRQGNRLLSRLVAPLLSHLDNRLCVPVANRHDFPRLSHLVNLLECHQCSRRRDRLFALRCNPQGYRAANRPFSLPGNQPSNQQTCLLRSRPFSHH